MTAWRIASLLLFVPAVSTAAEPEAIFGHYGYIPTGIGCNTILPNMRWDAFSDTGGYAHLISAAAQWILYLEGKRDGDVHKLPPLDLP